MSTAFSRTLRLIESDRGRRSTAGLLATGALLTGWAAWSAFSHVTLYEITGTARLEVDRAVYPIQSPIGGRVTRTWLAVGNEVHPGDPLIELDTSGERLQAVEEHTRLTSLAPQIDALRSQIAAEERARADEKQASLAAAEEARANARQSEVPAAYSSAEGERLRQLRAAGLISERDYQRGRADASQARSVADRDGIAVQRVELEQRTRESDRLSRIRSLESEIVRIQGQMEASRATAGRLENEIERRTIRGQVAGRLGEVASLRVGSVVAAGEKIGSIVPSGHLVVVAQFPPSAALGRIAPGQRAQLRLDGFPWTQYGSVPAQVARVASEVRDGQVRVELSVDSSRPGRIPLQHGLPGSAEVAVERVTPAALMLRAAGSLLTVSRPLVTN